ncbi:type VII toxin-antitoxin system HepT family RNase toxin [Clostridium sp. JNZ J1-5]
MTRNILDTINGKIKELQKNLILLKTTAVNINRENLKEDMLRYWGIERGIQISIECIIDICNIIISTLDIEKPDTYREGILVLGENNILPQKFSKNIANMVSFRNILVHDYTRVDEKIMIDILHNHLDDFGKFMNYINKWLEKNY